MGKVSFIKKSRKENKCSKCSKEIPVGSSYYRGIINFHPDIIRCQKCGLEHWEVTTSDYQLSVGEIVNRWQDNYGLGSIEDIVSELEAIKGDLQDRLDNMPENLQYSETGELLQNRIDCLESVISDLEGIDLDSIRSDVEKDSQDEEEIEERYEEELTMAIDDALSNIEY